LSVVLNVSLIAKLPPPNFRRLAAIARCRNSRPRCCRWCAARPDCIVRKVSADPRYSADMRPNEINDLIVDSISACGRLVRADDRCA